MTDSRRTYKERRAYSARVMRFRKAVYEPREGMTNGCRLLLLRLSDDMDANGIVSIPRSDLAAHLGVAPARITESIALARKLGFLDVVKRARPQVTAVYSGLIPASEVRPTVPLETNSEVRPPGHVEVRPAVPLNDVLRYALPMPQEVEPFGGNAQSGSGEPWETTSSQDEGAHGADPNAHLLALFDSQDACPHNVPLGFLPAPWNSKNLTCPECHADRSKSDRDRWTA